MNASQPVLALCARWAGLLIATLLLSACITTTEGGFTEKADPKEALELRVELARKYIGEGDWENAKRNLKMAYEMDPNNAEVHEAFALVYQSTGEFELAEQSYKTAIRLNRGFSRARNNYAAFLYSQARYREAAEQLEYVVKDSLYQARPQAFVNLGLCREQLFESAAAEQAFMRALTMDRTNSIALLELAVLRYEAEDYPTAGKYYGTYRTVVRQQSARGLWLGIRLARANGDADAEASYALALANLYPESAEYQAYKRTQ
ncbi:type IV pilus biogenesis/stability protein PilW [Mangrovimicrobium sediminis]|uniref:Type IV pilus biogenesis/stability protein PilW n=1 Tax=Mangrovimicrobium sediminis TaxID=2562682 RepID=A0A4Z0M2U8_9GAMM|nr:type IV pilus biogenesis/stability protein PilW [Haliea sp. SAOS-164]TGD73932.1 type IV pilus biogenesis/stability protein PilW [Haliea sp. SAOS-164]